MARHEMEALTVKREQDGLEEKLRKQEQLLEEGRRVEQIMSQQNADLATKIRTAEADQQAMRQTIHERDKEIQHLRGSLAASTEDIHRLRQEVQVTRRISLSRVVSPANSVPSCTSSQAVPTGSVVRPDEGIAVRELKRKIVSLEVDLVGKEAIITELYTRLG